jgi:hypothetical protein
LKLRYPLILGLSAVLILSGALIAMQLFSTVAGTNGNDQGVSITGKVTVSLLGPNGNVVKVWHTHNSLVAGGISEIAACLSDASAVDGSANGNAFCPGGSVPTASFDYPFTYEVGIAVGSCTSTTKCSNSVTPIPAQISLTPLGCASSYTCTGWLVSAGFPASDFTSGSNGATDCGSSNPCPVNDIAALGGAFFSSSGFTQFDDIPSSNFPSAISVTIGDSLQINIQFTVS